MKNKCLINIYADIWNNSIHIIVHSKHLFFIFLFIGFTWHPFCSISNVPISMQVFFFVKTNTYFHFLNYLNNVFLNNFSSNFLYLLSKIKMRKFSFNRLFLLALRSVFMVSIDSRSKDKKCSLLSIISIPFYFPEFL